MTTVVNIRETGLTGCVYIGRPSIWGNPFTIRGRFTRERAIAAYEEWIKTKPELLARLPELKGRRLACYCKPLPCHGDVLARLTDEGKA